MSGRRVCAWCEADLGQVEDLPDGDVTHGLCPRCKWRELASLGIPVSPVITHYDCGNHCTVTGQPAPEKCKHGKDKICQNSGS